MDRATRNELQELLVRLCDDALQEADQRRLAELLGDPEAQDA